MVGWIPARGEEMDLAGISLGSGNKRSFLFWCTYSCFGAHLVREKSSCDLARGMEIKLGNVFFSALLNPSEVVSPSHPGWSVLQDPWISSSLIPNYSFGLLPFLVKRPFPTPLSFKLEHTKIPLYHLHLN